MRVLQIFVCLLTVGLLSACDVKFGGDSFSFGNACESRGYTQGTAAYQRCVNDLGGRSVISSGQRRSNTGRGGR